MEKHVSFLQLFRRYIKYHRKGGDHFEKRKTVTVNAYANKYLHVEEFLRSEGLVKIKALEFTVGIAKRFHSYLSGKEFSHNYAARVVGICRTVLDFGAQHEFIKYNPLGSLSMPKNGPADPPYFTPEQIRRFENYTSEFSMRRKAASMFVLQLHTGFDYGDLSEVSRKHIVFYKGREYIVKPRHKNGNQAVIPLTEKAKELLELYDYKMCMLSNVNYNLAIKEVAKDLGISIHLTAKAGRKLFMMNKLNNEGLSIEATSKMGGHKSIKTTELYYARVNINLISKELDRLGV